MYDDVTSVPADATPCPQRPAPGPAPFAMSLSAPRLPDQLFDLLAADIRQGVFATGERLPTEGEICERYGVSRTVLREAVSRLKAEGMIETRQGSGTYVLGPSFRTPFRFDASAGGTKDAIVKLAELRLGVEGTAAGLAAARATPAQRRRLRQCLERMASAVRNGTDGSQADLEFHETVAEATGNAHYRLFMDYLRQAFAVAIDTARRNSAREEGLSQAVQEEHAAVYEAIVAGDAAAAEKAMKRHIRNAAVRLTRDEAGR